MASSTFKLTSPETLDIVQRNEEIFWDKCFICQDELEGKEVLKPYRKAGFAANPESSSYHTTAENLKQWQLQHELPNKLNERISNLTSLELTKTFIENFAVFHKYCVTKYNRDKLKRKASKNDTKPSHKKVSTRSLYDSQNFNQICFFCEGQGELHSCETISLDRHVREIAEVMSESKILAKLSEGDMCATEAKYHKRCLTSFYNKFRNFKKSQIEPSEIHIIEGIALAGVIKWVKDAIEESFRNDVTPVFEQKELVKLYNKLLILNGAPSDHVKNTHCTRLKNNILNNVPGLYSSKSKQGGRFVVLTIEDEVGRAIFEMCLGSAEEEEKSILSKAASIVRKNLFDSDVIFNGDVSKAHQRSVVPPALVNLLNMILEVSKKNEPPSLKVEKISCNLAQLIRFNAVKGYRNSSSTHLRHSPLNEPPLPVLIGLIIYSKTRKKSLINSLANEGVCITYSRLMKLRRKINNDICQVYLDKGYVCPKSLQHGVFTSAAIDNIDHNLSSTTAKGSFHGTSISIFQHFDSDTAAREPFRLDLSSSKNY